MTTEQTKAEIEQLQSAYYDELVGRAESMTQTQWAAYCGALVLATGAIIAERLDADKDKKTELAGRIINAAIDTANQSYTGGK